VNGERHLVHEPLVASPPRMASQLTWMPCSASSSSTSRWLSAKR
jgi:hypothetical protein